MWILTQVLLAHALLISGTGQCPAASEVREHLNQLLPGLAGDESFNEQIILTETGDGGLELEMRSTADGTVLSRRLPPRESCGEQGLLAATVIASWQTELQRPLLLLPQIAASPPIAENKKPTPLPPPPRSLKYELSLAFLASLDGAGFAPGGSFEAILMPTRHPLQLRFGLFGLGPREIALGQGRGHYGRAALRTGVGYRLLSRAWTLDVAADFLAALLYMNGDGFENNLTSFGIDAGLAPSVRLGSRIGPLRLFLDFTLAGWLRNSELTTQPLGGAVQPGDMGRMGDHASLPRIEGLFSLGLTYFRADSASRSAIP